MKRLITYLYDYAGGTKGKSAGFVRMDLRGREIRMEVHVRDTNRFQGKGKIYLIAKEDRVIGIYMGDITIINGNGDEALKFFNANLNGSGMNFSGVIGIAIQYNDGYLASNWKEENCPELVRGTFEVFPIPNKEKAAHRESKMIEEIKEPQESELAAEIKEMQESEAAAEIKSAQESEVAAEIKSVQESEAVAEIKTAQESEAAAQERESETEIEEPQEGISASEIVEAQTREHAEDRGEIGENIRQRKEMSLQEPVYRKIQLTHIRDLPVKNGYLCNNSFLLHGFFNYNYLILKKEKTKKGEKWSLGVPGVYEQPERMMALMFGFPEFEAQSKEINELKEGTFGAWFTVLVM